MVPSILVGCFSSSSNPFAAYNPSTTISKKKRVSKCRFLSLCSLLVDLAAEKPTIPVSAPLSSAPSSSTQQPSSYSTSFKSTSSSISDTKPTVSTSVSSSSSISAPTSSKGNLNMSIVNAAYSKRPVKPAKSPYPKRRSRSPSYSYSDSYSYSYSDESYSDRSHSRSRSSSRTRRREPVSDQDSKSLVNTETGVTKRLTKAEKQKLRQQKTALKLEIQNEDAVLAEERKRRIQRFQGFSSTPIVPRGPEPSVRSIGWCDE